MQTPAGFLVDRLGARTILIAGLAIEAAAFAIAGSVHSFWLMVAMFALAGVGNTVYHPAEYAMLSQQVSNERIGQAFSIHTFAGLLGTAVAPASLLLMQNLWGWRGSFVASAMLGFGMAAVLAVGRDNGAHGPAKPRTGESAGAPAGWALLFSRPILRNLAFFVLLALISGGMNNYSVVALAALHDT